MRGSLGLHLTDQVPDPSTLSQNAQKLITRHPWQPFKEQIDTNEPTAFGRYRALLVV